MNVVALQAQIRLQLETAVIDELSSLPLIRPLKRPEIASLAQHAVTAVLRRTSLVQNERVHHRAESTRTLAERLTAQAESIGRECLVRGLMGAEEAKATIGSNAVSHTLFTIVLSPYGHSLPDQGQDDST